MKKVTIIGGGLSGLITSIQLARSGVNVQLFEKKNYPFHRVCGEYISNETIPFLNSLDLFPKEFDPPSISKLQITSTNGKLADLNLDLGGFGISRYNYDNWLYKRALAVGVVFHLNTEISSVTYVQGKFNVSSLNKTYETDLVIGSFGKRSKIDVKMGRAFTKKRSPYIGIKYHVKTDHPSDRISLHNFHNGYCGISNIENGVSNLCYLSNRSNLKKYGSIKLMEENVLFKNPFIKRIFDSSSFLLDAPETINEISFDTKLPVEDHILMSGDAAGMITPLCGNGMAMAIHSSKILSELVVPFCKSNHASRAKLELVYTESWNKTFANRLRAGRQIQKLFGASWASNFAVFIANYTKPAANYLVSKTHGKPF